MNTPQHVRAQNGNTVYINAPILIYKKEHISEVILIRIMEKNIVVQSVLCSEMKYEVEKSAVVCLLLNCKPHYLQEHSIIALQKSILHSSKAFMPYFPRQYPPAHVLRALVFAPVIGHKKRETDLYMYLK